MTRTRAQESRMSVSTACLRDGPAGKLTAEGGQIPHFFSFSDWYTGMAQMQFRFERQRAYDRLIDFILSGNADPEKPLSERSIAESLDIGRTPVREAM